MEDESEGVNPEAGKPVQRILTQWLKGKIIEA